MKCYLTLTAPASDDDPYVDLLEVTLKSARENTTLDVHVLYDGPEDCRTFRLMKQYGAKVIPHRFSHYEEVQRLFRTDFKGRPVDSRKVAGTFMRLDIPFLEKEEEYVLYVDMDVFFIRDVRAEDLPKPEYLAASSEFSRQQNMKLYFNAGVLVMNVRNMRRRCKKIFRDLKEGKATPGFDQGYLNKYCLADRTWLPVEYNWKPYWGVNPQAAIIHYHGMKPGGTNENSGFGMSDGVTRKLMLENDNCLEGLLYYYKEFFHYLAPSHSEWIPWLESYLLKAQQLAEYEE